MPYSEHLCIPATAGSGCISLRQCFRSVIDKIGLELDLPCPIEMTEIVLQMAELDRTAPRVRRYALPLSTATLQLA